jgi:hypothetical protein
MNSWHGAPRHRLSGVQKLPAGCARERVARVEAGIRRDWRRHVWTFVPIHSHERRGIWTKDNLISILFYPI